MPTVTVIVPNFNHATYLPQRLDSILNQTFPDYELIYLDDGSSDESNTIAGEYAARHKFRIIVNSQNSGSAFSQWNKGVSEASGKYVWIAEADDFADRCFLKRLVPILESNPDVGIAYCQSTAVDECGNKLFVCDHIYREIGQLDFSKDYIASGKDELRLRMAWANTVPNASAVVFRRETFLSSGGSATDMRLCGDWVTWARMMFKCKVAFIAEPLNYFRWHTNSVRSNMGLSWQSMRENYIARSVVASLVDIPEATRQATEDYSGMCWLDLVRSSPERFRLRDHWRVYLAARRFDRHVNRRVARKLARVVLGTVGLQKFASMLSKSRRRTAGSN